jgi:hypothetical protein
MNLSHFLSCDNTLCIVHFNGTLRPPELYLAVSHSAHPKPCDSCALKAHCHDVFGERGKTCPAYQNGYRWTRIVPEQVAAIKAM